MDREFLPISVEDMKRRGWNRPDFVYVIGDAYVDHSSFGPAIISRVLESRGYKVAIISQPDYRDENSIAVLGEPRLGFLVSAGNMDSMVNHYTVNKKPRSNDAYTPGGQSGRRPDYATIVYCNLINRKFKNTPVIIGGIEASLRRLAHYDYWSDKLKRSILLDSGADLLIYGMGELSVVEIADALDSGIDIRDITYVPGTVYKTRDVSGVRDGIVLPDYSSLQADRLKYAESFYIQYCNADFASGRPLIEQYAEHRYVVANPPQRPLKTQELDDIYELPYMNTYHPSYEARGGVPAISEIRFSLTSSRGCFGGCSFCALTFHQGRIVQARSHESLIREAQQMTKEPDFKGNIHDVGGPTANFRAPACGKQTERGACPKKQCLFPAPCKQLRASHKDYVELLRKLRNVKGVRKVFIRSGIRYDYVLADPDDTFLEELCRHHISGQLRVAPEHVSDHVLALMGKPSNQVYQAFCRRFERINARSGRQQYIVPYLISSHPGSTLKDAIQLAEAVRDMGYMPEQVQDFYPTPSTISTVMYYTGVDPRSMQPVYIPSDPREKAMQRALIQYRKPENYDLVKEALLREGRQDLIGFDRKKCLIPPRRPKATGAAKGSGRTKPSGTAKGSGGGKGSGGTKPSGTAKGQGGTKPSGSSRAGKGLRQRSLSSRVSKI
ncbi:MAG: YgiQ family radical SAM protein [Parasporobacterium sp.]|nr:YgiQ family radical SAM protein [Parasporobacterium sp.]MBQ9033024.1 YgiQ family radical SAM protein [Parasporobacterium sp.]